MISSGNFIIDIFDRFGQFLFIYIVIIVYLIVFGFMKVHWRCGMCGKINTTSLIKFFLQMCDHMGQF